MRTLDERQLAQGYFPTEAERTRESLGWLHAHDLPATKVDAILAKYPWIWALELHAEPLVMFVQWHIGLHLLPRPAGQPAYLMLVLYHPAEPELLAAWCEAHRARHPGDVLVFLCWSEWYVTQLRRRGIEAHFCHLHALLDETLFRPVDPAHRRFDAVLNANTGPWKRHFLAAKIPNWALITYFFENERTRGIADLGKILALPGCHLLQSPDGLNATEVAANLAGGGVGLSFSSLEGPAYATSEYLLAGLPVVYTHNIGRTEMIPPEFGELVAADEEQVADAVARLLARRIDPTEVRRRALEVMAPHRRRFAQQFNAGLAWAGASRRLSLDGGVPLNKMLKARSLRSVFTTGDPSLRLPDRAFDD